MQTKVQKWGNSLALRIPHVFATELGVKENSEVEITVVENQIIIKPIERSDDTLEELVAKITPENKHGEIDFGPAVGKEVW